jgi:galactitol-specific phosphotransferase system IIB component
MYYTEESDPDFISIIDASKMFHKWLQNLIDLHHEKIENDMSAYNHVCNFMAAKHIAYNDVKQLVIDSFERHGEKVDLIICANHILSREGLTCSYFVIIKDKEYLVKIKVNKFFKWEIEFKYNSTELEFEMITTHSVNVEILEDVNENVLKRIFPIKKLQYH